MKFEELVERLKEDYKICGRPLRNFDVVVSGDRGTYLDTSAIVDYDIDFGTGKIVLLTDDKEEQR